MFAKLTQGLPIDRLEADTAPIKTHNGGNLWRLPTGWTMFVAHTATGTGKGGAALLRPDGTIALRGWWAGSGRWPEVNFEGTLVGFPNRTKRRESILAQAGLEVVDTMPF